MLALATWMVADGSTMSSMPESAVEGSRRRETGLDQRLVSGDLVQIAR